MKKITEGKVLICADAHQDAGYLNKCFELEPDCDHTIFVADFFDTFLTPDGKNIYDVTQMCEWINEKLEKLGDRATWLCSNHDIAYLASYTKDYTKTKPNPYYNCSGWTKNKAKYINKTINPEYWNRMELCVQLGDNTIVSHAGFNVHMMKPYMSELDNIKWYYDEWEKDKHTFKYEPWHWIWDVGGYRGGMALAGSPVWLDYSEFQPLDNIRQVFGHSTSQSTEIRCKESGSGLKNYCIDNMQQTFAVWEKNFLTIKDIYGNILK